MKAAADREKVESWKFLLVDKTKANLCRKSMKKNTLGKVSTLAKGNQISSSSSLLIYLD
ncbi:hypothetical protein [Chryseobacterium jejuense]|uniref:hypothetical protein n=1 Tax=Chryseobacterium jejuense TaxID=445960 RepID=UPI001428D2E3|nr:hypothetical protein [Chryseobacterium jejuense]